ncbi:dynamin family protein [Thalassobacillus devorans]|uniref:dynamin family protein n=1 Tax=Thalassobacillus devorans TaxID=279813 RepID=UPI00048C0C2D|nr:dynamin family protein [Thalassobacillus devorans]
MNVTTKDSQLTKEALRLSGLYHELNRQGKDKHAEKVLDLISKWEKKQLVIGFAGHFSAGKSTMINTLLEDDILPSSPIPTSANVVKLQSGDDYTRVFYREENPVHYRGKPEMETIQSLCKDGDEIVSLEISQRDTNLPEHVTLIDTPGVDSTNDADRIITESSLHLMDYMYYVMDYNHVQSEVNLSFLQEMQKNRLPFSVIINQVDKHQDEELSFLDFKASVNKALQDWNLSPDNIFYTSLMKQDLVINELPQLKIHLEDIYQLEERERAESIFRNASLIIEESVDQLAEENDEEEAELIDNIEALKTAMDNQNNSEDPEAELRELSTREEKAESFYQERVLSLFKNAYLMPTTLREDAERYLEAMQPGFKVGLMFTKKKTEEERDQRKQDFYTHLMKVVEKNLKWPLRDRLLEVVEAYPVAHSQVTDHIQNMDIHYSEQRLEDLIEPGAKVTGQYVLVYTDKVAEDIKRVYKTYVKELWETIKKGINEESNAKMASFEDERQLLEKIQHYREAIENLEKEIENHRTQLWTAFQSESLDGEHLQHIQEMLTEREAGVEEKETFLAGYQQKKAPEQEEVELQAQDEGQPATIDKDATLKTIAQVVETIEDTPGFQELAAQLTEKGKRLKDQEFTVALFGAFSAGKSSFANALIKEKLLPVSPNPTTATINKIAPPNEHHPHGSISVKMKTESQMVEDLQAFASILGIEENRLPALVNELAALEEKDFQPLEHKQRSFVYAVLEGYAAAENKIGEQLTIGLDEFPGYVADEKKSCFVEWMQVHYDCPLTQKGITLVDTPGADSVNARHTDVAFEYIRNADAILFITYYNHPFSKADESFLTQLGRVKDAFSMDKMFFLINAADLAQSEEELDSVLTYMEEQLLRFQIRKPQLFPISSLYALRGDDEKDNLTGKAREGFSNFEERFYAFIDRDLPEVLIRSIEHDFNRAKSRMDTIIADASLDQSARMQKIEVNNQDKEEMLEVLSSFSYAPYHTRIAQKIEKQVYYIHQRMLLNFNDYFKHHFNPATIKGSGKEAKLQLEMAAESLFQEVSYELNQELRAVSLRIEGFLNDSLIQLNQDLQRRFQEIRKSFELSEPETQELQHPAFNFIVHLDSNETNRILQSFKGTKKFFEQNEKEQMKEAFKAAVDPVIKGQLDEAEQEVNGLYLPQWDEIVTALKQDKNSEIGDYYDGLNYNLEHPLDIEALRIKLKQLNKLH